MKNMVDLVLLRILRLMVNKMMVFLLMLFMPLFSYSQLGMIKTLSDYTLKGEVKQIEEISYNFAIMGFVNQNGNLEEQFKIIDQYEFLFNEKGFLTKESRNKGKSDDVLCIYEMETNNLIEYKSKNLKVEFNYDSSKNIIEVKKYEKDVLKYSKINEYDEHNNLKSSKIDDCGRESEMKYINEYQSDKLVKVTLIVKNETALVLLYAYDKGMEILLSNTVVLYEEGKARIKQVHEYDKNKHLLKRMTENYKSDSISSKEICEYKNDSLTSEVHYNSENIITRKKNYSYNANGMVSLKESYVLNEKKTLALVSKTTYQYDARSNLVEERTEMFNHGKLENTIRVSYSYQYDEHGNWVVRCKSVGNEGVRVVTKRDIVYYNQKSPLIIPKEQALKFCDPLYEKKLKEYQDEIKKDMHLIEKSVK